MVLVVSKANVDQVLQVLRSLQEEPVVVGELVDRVAGKDPVEVERALGNWMMLPELGVSLPFPEVLSSLQAPRVGARVRTAILGGRQRTSVLQAVVQQMSNPARATEIVSLLTLDPKSSMLQLSDGKQSKVLANGSLSLFDASEKCPEKDRAAFSQELQATLEAAGAEQLLILSDVSTFLFTQEFLENWVGKALLVHHSLLPSFAEAQPIQAALSSGVCITGCSVCFVLPSPVGSESKGLCHGPIVTQDSTRVLATDTVDTLRERVVSECELKAVPSAVRLVSEGAVTLDKEPPYKLNRQASVVDDSDDER